MLRVDGLRCGGVALRQRFPGYLRLGRRVRDELFARFPGARARLQAALPEDIFQAAAYRFWFLERDGEPWTCLETTGMAWLADGSSLDLVAEYRRHRNVHAIAALLTT